MTCVQLRVTLLLLGLVGTSAWANSACDVSEKLQFDVVVASREPLGMRLSEKLEVLEFLADAEGRPRAVEASGLAEVGDKLLRVNGECVSGLSGGLRAAVEALHAAKRPLTLRFMASDGRQLLIENKETDKSTASLSPEAPTLKTTKESFDYVLLSDGELEHDMKLFAALSGDGKPPSCSFRPLVVAEPDDACSPITNAAEVVDKYVLVPVLDGCPAHQKALLVQEAGGKGIILVSRDNKPRQVRLPPARDLPMPLRFPIAMISSDSGWRARKMLSSTPPSHEVQLRFVFSAECADDKYSIHIATFGEEPELEDESGDPRLRPVTAGFMSVSIASTASSVLSSATYEFLRPNRHHHRHHQRQLGVRIRGRRLPLGKHDLVLADDSSIFKPCETDESKVSPLLRFWAEEIQGKVALAPLMPSSPASDSSVSSPHCSMSQQLAYYSTFHFVAAILYDTHFPEAAQSLDAITASAKPDSITLPFVFVSSAAYRAIRQTIADTIGNSSDTRTAAMLSSSDENGLHVQIEFSGDNSLHHHWRELEHLASPANWPSSATGRERLLHRMLKDHASISDQSAHLALAANERYDVLQDAFDAANKYHVERHRQLKVAQELGDSAMLTSLSDRESSPIHVVHDNEGDSSTTITMYA